MHCRQRGQFYGSSQRCAMLNTIVRVHRRVSKAAAESGQAMLIVIASLGLMATIPMVVIATTTNQLPLTTGNLNWNAAYEAAQAGVNDYIQKLDVDQTFTQWSHGRFNCATSNPSGDPAFCNWVPIAGTNESYEYTLPTTSTGNLALTVSGKAGSGARVVVRSFTYTLLPRSTLDYLWWTNFEEVDPAINANCDGLRGGNCPIYFASIDHLWGPVFSNDTFHMDGTPTFESTVTSSNGNPLYVCSNNGCAPNFNGGAPVAGSNQPEQGTSAVAAPAQNLGCFISLGTWSNPTPINNVQMALSVVPGTNTTTITGNWNANIANQPGNPNTSNGHHFCTSPITVSNLASGLIYVNGNVTIHDDPNGNGGTTGFTTIVAGGLATDKTNGNITIDGNIQYPAANIVGGITDTSDALGLIAQNVVKIAHPTNGNNNAPICNLALIPTPLATNCDYSDYTIDAALFAVSDSIYVENWSIGAALGHLNIFGAMAQNYRGPVGTVGGSGYAKAYKYDSSLLALWPPFFMAPTSATWSPTSYSEARPGCASAQSLGLVTCP